MCVSMCIYVCNMYVCALCVFVVHACACRCACVRACVGVCECVCVADFHTCISDS